MKVAGCFLEYDGKFVILLRHAHKPSGNNWGLPAGKVETGEDSKSAILRELEEETGYHATKSELELLGDFRFGDGDSQYTFATYHVKLAQPHKVKLEDAAHAEYRWVTPVECYSLQNLVPDFHELLKLVNYM